MKHALALVEELYSNMKTIGYPNMYMEKMARDTY
jgi:hypothetical protein